MLKKEESLIYRIIWNVWCFNLKKIWDTKENRTGLICKKKINRNYARGGLTIGLIRQTWKIILNIFQNHMYPFLKKLKESMRLMCQQIENINRETEFRLNKWILELKSTITEMKEKNYSRELLGTTLQ